MTAPALAAQVQGQASVSADNLNTYVLWCSNTSQLRAFIGLAGMQVYLQGVSAINDGGQGTFVWYATVSHTDDNANYIIPSGGGGGGWARLGPALVNPVPIITGVLSAVTDANAKAVLTSIISTLTTLGLATNGTT